MYTIIVGPTELNQLWNLNNNKWCDKSELLATWVVVSNSCPIKLFHKQHSLFIIELQSIPARSSTAHPFNSIRLSSVPKNYSKCLNNTNYFNHSRLLIVPTICELWGWRIIKMFNYRECMGRSSQFPSKHRRIQLYIHWNKIHFALFIRHLKEYF